MGTFVVAITGASGSIYGRRLLEVLGRAEHTVHFTVSHAAAKVIEHELNLTLDLNRGDDVIQALMGSRPKNVQYHHVMNLEVPIASGSYKTDGMIIVPCSTGTLGRISSGSSSNLIERAADVTLKERRRLIVVPRETPLSLIHLKNMVRLTQAGAMVLPASPGFYGYPEGVDDLINFVVSRILDHIGVDNKLMHRYISAPALKEIEE